MAFIDTIPTDAAAGDVADMYETDRAGWGFLPNFTRAYSHRPDVYAAWRGLNGSIKANMDERRYEIATLAAARRLRSSYCSLAHGRILARHMPASAVSDIAQGRPSDELDDVDRAVIELADKVAADASAANRAAPILMAHGIHDPLIPLARAVHARDTLAALGYPVEWHAYPMPHSVCDVEVMDIAAWLARVLA